MAICLVNIDSKIPNIALHKTEKYYTSQGEEVKWNDWKNCSNIYVSIIFNWNRNRAKQFEYLGANIGGSGYSLETVLPKEIEKQKVKLNIGFTTRGCIRNCGFCIVPKKEGGIRVVGDIYDFWDGKSKNLTILDNNILAVRDHFKLICSQINKENLVVDFNQGLDCRLLDNDVIETLKTTHHAELRFAFDDIKYKNVVEEKIKLLQSRGIKRCIWYVLVGYNSHITEDLERLNILRKYDQDAFVQRYCYNKNNLYIPIARWANQHNVFRKMTFREFILHPTNKRWRTYIELMKNWGEMKEVKYDQKRDGDRST